MSRNACSNENGENSVKNRQIRQADFASTNLTKTRQTRQFRQADCALTNLTIMCQNRQILVTGNYRGLKKLGQRSLGKDPSSISLETV